jgi:3-oxoacyl-[acyl-carrier protein] reductase
VTNRAAFDFTGATVLVTGGTSGIGNATARRFRDAGANVTITGTKPGPDDYQADLSRMTYRQLVLTDPTATDQLAASFSTLDALVNNAGANFPGGLDEATPDGFRAAVELNLLAPFRLTAALHGALKASGAGGGASVIMLASMSALRAVPLVPGYGSAKAGVLALTHNLAVRWATDGIRVNAVVPGVIDTPMTAPMSLVPAIKQQQLDHIPVGRLGTPDEIASVILFLCTENASYATGCAVHVDGGYSVM